MTDPALTPMIYPSGEKPPRGLPPAVPTMTECKTKKIFGSKKYLVGLRRCGPPHKQPPLISESTNTPGLLQETNSCRQGIVMVTLRTA